MVMKLASSPWERKSSWNCWHADASRSTATAMAPSSAHILVIAAPMPFAPPVTSTTLFLSWRSMESAALVVNSNLRSSYLVLAAKI